MEQQFSGMVTCREVNYYTRTIDGETWHYFDLELRLKESELTRESAESEFGKEREPSLGSIWGTMTPEVTVRMVKRGKRWYFEWIEG